jgi:hypothetical protein
MDPTEFRSSPVASDDQAARDLTEIEIAIDLVAAGAASRVRLVSLSRPESVAAQGLAEAQAAGVGFALERDAAGAISLTLGPLLELAGEAQ